MFKRYFILLLGSIFLLQLAGCGAIVKSNDYMEVRNPDKKYYPSPGKSLFIVERNNDMTGAIYNMILWDVTDRKDPKLIAYIRPTMKAAYEMDPGEKTILLTFANSTTMMKIDAAPDKTYFSRIGVGWGYVQFYPIKQGMDNDVTRDNISVAKPNLIEWSKNEERKQGSLQTRIGKGQSHWNQMSVEDKVKKNMVAADGR
jgi:hypothetical protein